MSNRKLTAEHIKKMEIARKKLKVTIECKYCGKSFTVSFGCRDRIFCGKSCQSKAIIRKPSIKKKSLCVVCKEEFEHYGERILCSKKCQSLYMAQTRLGQNNPAFNKDKEEKAICENCKNEFLYSRMGLHIKQKKRFCSLACSHGFFRGKSKDGGPLKYLNPYPIEFKKIKKYIKERDNNSCAFCGKTEKLHVHHIDYDKNNNEESNLITLCQLCHMLTNTERMFWINVFSALLSGSKIVPKGWGVEFWIANNSSYCLKYLIFFKGKEFSFHSHDIKKELWHCLFGKFECVLDDGNIKDYCLFNKGDKIELEPGVIHQLKALKNSIIVEISTQHFEEDSHRVIKGD